MYVGSLIYNIQTPAFDQCGCKRRNVNPAGASLTGNSKRTFGRAFHKMIDQTTLTYSTSLSLCRVDTHPPCYHFSSTIPPPKKTNTQRASCPHVNNLQADQMIALSTS